MVVVDVVFTVFVSVEVSVLGGIVFWWVFFRGLYGGYGVQSICGTICILFRPYLASCEDDV
jgi:hypothetical protein